MYLDRTRSISDNGLNSRSGKTCSVPNLENLIQIFFASKKYIYIYIYIYLFFFFFFFFFLGNSVFWIYSTFI